MMVGCWREQLGWEQGDKEDVGALDAAGDRRERQRPQEREALAQQSWWSHSRADAAKPASFVLALSA